MKRALFASLSLTFAFACTPAESGGDEDPGTSSGETETTAETSDTLTGDGDGDGEPAEPIGTIDGIILDTMGNPLPSPGLQFCGTIEEDGIPKLCIPVGVDDDGGFHIDAMTAGLWSLKLVHADVDGRMFSGQAFQLTLNEGDALDYSDPPIVLPEVTSVSALEESGETAVSIEGGLTVMLDASTAQMPDFSNPTELGGVVVEPAYWPWMDVDGEAIVQVWGMSPFGIKAKEGAFDLVIEDGLGLDAGAAVNVYEIEKDNGALHLIATGAVNEDASGLELTAEDEGLHELSWIIVTEG